MQCIAILGSRSEGYLPWFWFHDLRVTRGAGFFRLFSFIFANCFLRLPFCIPFCLNVSLLSERWVLKRLGFWLLFLILWTCFFAPFVYPASTLAILITYNIDNLFSAIAFSSFISFESDRALWAFLFLFFGILWFTPYFP